MGGSGGVLEEINTTAEGEEINDGFICPIQKYVSRKLLNVIIRFGVKFANLDILRGGEVQEKRH